MRSVGVAGQELHTSHAKCPPPSLGVVASPSFAWLPAVTPPLVAAVLQVDNSNKAQFVSLRAKWALTGCVREALEMLRAGLADVVPPMLLLPFSPAELERLLVGQPSVDVTEVRAFTTYQVSYLTFYSCILQKKRCTSCCICPWIFWVGGGGAPAALAIFH